MLALGPYPNGLNGHTNELNPHTNGVLAQMTGFDGLVKESNAYTNESSNQGKPRMKQSSLTVINYEAIANDDPAERQKLLTACQKEGMFYLDLRGPRTAVILDDVPSLWRIGNEFFKLPMDSSEKTSALREGQERGYHFNKALQYYEIPRDEYGLGTWRLPSILEPEKELVDRSMESLNNATQKILRNVCGAIDLDIPELNDDPSIPSDSAIKLLFKPAVHEIGNVVVGSHTDFGLLTFLWYDEVTTQLPVYDENGAQTGEWMEVPVVEGTMLVNVADELAARSGGRLHSTVHRVVCPPGPKRTKNGLIYLLRPYKNEA